MVAPGSNVPTQIGGVPPGVGVIHSERHAPNFLVPVRQIFLSSVSYFTLVSNLMGG
jgi:hypothetical protein